MGSTELAGFALVAALLVMSPGPNGILIAKSVAGSGRRAGACNIAGFVAAFYLHGALSVFGLSVILARSAELFFVVKALGAAYLIYLGVRALREAWRGLPPAARPQAGRRRTMAAALAEGFLTNALNPKVSLFYLAAFPQFIPPGDVGAGWSLALVSIHAALNIVWFGSMVVLFDRLARLGARDAVRRWLKAATGLVFVAFGVKLMTARLQ